MSDSFYEVMADSGVFRIIWAHIRKIMGNDGYSGRASFYENNTNPPSKLYPIETRICNTETLKITV